MGLFGNFLDSMRIDPGQDDEYYGDDYIDEPQKSGGFFGRGKSKQDDYDYEDEPEQKSGLFSRKQTNITPVRKGMEVAMVKPNAIEDGRTICNHLLDGKAVVLNMEGIHTEIAQRIIDFTSGATYSMNGKLQKISNFIFIATPSQVELSGEFQDLLNANSFDTNGGTFRI